MDTREEIRQLMHKSKNEQSESCAAACFSIMSYVFVLVLVQQHFIVYVLFA